MGTDSHAATVGRLPDESPAARAAIRSRRSFVVSQPPTGNLSFNMHIIYSLPGQGTSFLPSLMESPSHLIAPSVLFLPRTSTSLECELI
jgi:hypothetical protein